MTSTSSAIPGLRFNVDIQRAPQHPDGLSHNCLLDYGRHVYTAAQHGLGILDVFPLEVQQGVIAHLDVENLFRFRRVNKRALEVVNSVPEFKKIMTHTPDTFRMAIGMQINHLYTLTQLFNKLCQQYCDHCGDEVAPYLDLLQLCRLCLQNNNKCPGRLPPLPLVCIDPNFRVPGFKSSQLEENPSWSCFTAIPGTYGVSVCVKPTYRDHINDLTPTVAVTQRVKLYASPLFVPFYIRNDLGPVIRMVGVLGKAMTCVQAPWLNPNKMEADFPRNCDLCSATYDDIVSSELRYGFVKLVQFPDFRLVGDHPPFKVYTKEGLAEHKEVVHGVGENGES